jgi:MATE family multidrug resistance protein
MKEFFRVNKDIFIRTLALIFTISFFTSKSAEVNDTVLAVNTILLQFVIFFSYFVDGFANAAEALTGRFIGARDRAGLLRSVRLIFLWSGGVAVFFVLLNAFGGRFIIGLMTNNSDIIAGSMSYLPWVIAVPIVSFTAFVWDGVYIGATSSVHLRNSILVALAVFLAVYYFAVPSMGNGGLWLAMLTFLTVRGIYLSIFAKKAVFGLIVND